jgi:hypothetical protein
MHKKYKVLAIFGIIVTILSPQIVVIAQEEEVQESLELTQTGVKSGEIVNCFDYYKFGTEGITLTAGSEQSEYKPYDLVEVSGEIVNNNNYPIIGLTVRARVLRSHPNPVEQRALYTTVDDFEVVENITLKAKESYTLQYAYNVLGNAPTGDYKIQYYVYNQDRFNLNGLSFTEDIVANMTEFRVEGGAEHIYLDKTQITVGGKDNDTRGFITQQEKGNNIPIKLPVVNPSNEEKEVEISYKLYKWDEILESNFIEEQIQIVNIKGNSKVDLEYKVESTEYPVYYVVIEANTTGEQDSPLIKDKSMAHIRFSVEGNNRPRVNWVGLSKNPFEGGEVELITCVHNTVFETDKGPVRMQSIAKDEKGRELSKIEYEGEMPSAINGIKNKLNTEKKFNTVTIETSIYNVSNELVDNIITNYNCNELSPELCVVETNNIINRSNILIAIGVLVISTIIGTGIWYRRNKRLKN